MEHPWDRRLGFWWIAEDEPERPAIVDHPNGPTLSFGELAGRAHQLVHALRGRGLGAGDVIAYALPNDVDPLVWQLATAEAGMRSIALNPALSGAEIGSIVDHSGAAVLVVHRQFASHLGGLVETRAAGSGPLRVSIGGPLDGFVDVTDLVEGRPTTVPPDRALGGAITYSSGTTGRPKGIWRPLPDVDPSVFADSMKTFGRAFDFRPFDGAHLVSAGMHHGGCQSFYHGALNVGQPLSIMAKFDAEQTLAMIERHRVTTAYMVPTQLVRLLRLPPAVRERYDVSSLRSVVHAAAPCPVEIKQQMLDWWGPVIWETYGGMEGAATIAKPHRWLEKPGTVGRPIRGITVQILDDTGHQVAPNEVGTIYLQSDGPRFEYHDEPELTESVYRGQAFTIGDMGYLDTDGYLFLCDRARDIIISGGVNIYPAEVEGVLLSHGTVGDVAVIGVPDAEWGEQVKAVVELTAGIDASDGLADELIAYCRARLTGYKCPRSIDFRASLPRTDGGKLAKRLLREDYWVASGRKL